MSYKKQKDKVDIVFVAKLAGVSAATVSRAINHPDLVQPKTRQRVDLAIRKSGYVRNRAAQTIYGRRSSTIGLVVPTVNHAIFAEVAQTLSEEVNKAGFTVLLASHGYNLDTEYEVVRKLLEHRVDALALIGLEHKPDLFQLIEQQNVPAMAIWSYTAQSAIPCIGADNQEAGRIAAEHLAILGHRRVALIFPPTKGNDRAKARLNAAMDVLNAQNIDLSANWRAEIPYSLPKSKQVCFNILDQPHRPTALLCGNDIIAHGAIFAAQKLGLAIPGDISILGIGDFAGSAEMEPPLTTVRIPARRIGTSAGQQIVEMITSSQSGEPRRTKFDLDLIMRSTTAPPKQGGDLKT